jgi:hypothetical protein
VHHILELCAMHSFGLYTTLFIYLFNLENHMSQELYQISFPKCQCIRTAKIFTSNS